MANKKGHRLFGNIRRLPSGRYQASYLGPDGIRHNAPDTFTTKGDAVAWLTIRQSELLQGEWTSPSRGRVLFQDFADHWVEDRELGERTRGKYRSLLRLHVEPYLGASELGEISTETVRRWLTRLRSKGVGASTRAGAYRFVRAVMNTAVDDERIKRNPCRVKGADKENADERPVASIPQVFALADAVPERYKALVLAAAFTSLRWGELAGLQRGDVDLGERTVHVRRTLMQLDTGRLVDGDPKSAASRRKISIPPRLVGDLRRHLDEYVSPGPRARVFTRDGG